MTLSWTASRRDSHVQNKVDSAVVFTASGSLIAEVDCLKVLVVLGFLDIGLGSTGRDLEVRVQGEIFIFNIRYHIILV